MIRIRIKERKHSGMGSLKKGVGNTTRYTSILPSLRNHSKENLMGPLPDILENILADKNKPL